MPCAPLPGNGPGIPTAGAASAAPRPGGTARRRAEPGGTAAGAGAPGGPRRRPYGTTGSSPSPPHARVRPGQGHHRGEQRRLAPARARTAARGHGPGAATPPGLRTRAYVTGHRRLPGAADSATRAPVRTCVRRSGRARPPPGPRTRAYRRAAPRRAGPPCRSAPVTADAHRAARPSGGHGRTSGRSGPGTAASRRRGGGASGRPRWPGGSTGPGRRRCWCRGRRGCRRRSAWRPRTACWCSRGRTAGSAHRRSPRPSTA